MSTLDYLMREGEEKGLIKGRKEGWKQGRKEGLIQGVESLALHLKALGVDSHLLERAQKAVALA